MLYRNLGNTGEKVSILGLGCMRLPVLGDDPSNIDEIAAEEIVRYAIDSGINYFDTAYPYHEGKSEDFLGKVLTESDREKVFLVTKMPSWLIESREDMDAFFEEQLEKLQTDYVDAYLIHTLNSDFWEELRESGLFEFLDTIKKEGKARYVGFSFHDDVELFREIVDAYPWDICQIQYNYLDIDYQAGKEGLLYAAEKGLGIVIMEPLRGGCLAENVPETILDIWDKNPVKRTPAEWGLRFLWDHPEINTVLSGMTTLSQLKENIHTAEKGEPKSLTGFEHELISNVRDVYREKLKVNCTGCRYCLPCPAGVNIPLNFKYLNNAMLFGDLEKARRAYRNHVGDDRKASNCINCGRCSERCPQDIPIPEMLEEIVELLEKE
ncbi:putative aldo/keto reductase-like oxidoreductase [Methanohalophilus levihalophilus]|uniref:aldo/keto reductase n=1 Tax=Methanohalophilus levihalophilus TaxID=1431282 RepID=UPI001AE2173E|nr:aldo/keto reductase [Methanohalophilus levihalophilus]MBP2029485.1 putative aldo/keto reductase-like oxidoreductase [Methanohalophilus levihalophilus]